MISKERGLATSHVGMLYLDWVKWATFCCNVVTVWIKVLMVGSKDVVVGIGMLDILGNAKEVEGIYKDVNRGLEGTCKEFE